MQKRLVLQTDDEVTVDAQFLKMGEKIGTGSRVDFACHHAFVGEPILPEVPVPVATSVPPIIAPSLNFLCGLTFASQIRKTFGHPISFSEGPGRREFLLVVSFGRARFKLDIHTVATVLQSCFGGAAGRFKVKLLKDRSF